MKSLVNLLIKHNFTLATCESLTGGLFAATLTQIPGAGKIFKGGLVVYQNQTKIKLAQVSPLTLEKSGAVSSECALEMAQNTQKILEAEMAISFTGNAGPTASENKPVGLVFISLSTQEKLINQTYQFSGSRGEIRKKVVREGIKLIKSFVKSRCED
ncbi:MAG: CinA family protein [Candidatus Moeniiplasma glomeromycotorum]|nr:CinA family protein [Candidatus Moeniiplasma glomeromycotorum]MCE8167401.1 CinA family protein [Candidatus Moeniiplasma glomeromycotorum]MCE8168585.1 CinA family protein [Candidatus Moeniiplasma glomeromycotorum]